MLLIQNDETLPPHLLRFIALGAKLVFAVHPHLISRVCDSFAIIGIVGTNISSIPLESTSSSRDVIIFFASILIQCRGEQAIALQVIDGIFSIRV